MAEKFGLENLYIVNLYIYKYTFHFTSFKNTIERQDTIQHNENTIYQKK